MVKNYKKLPEKFSETLLLAIKTIKEVEEDDKYSHDQRCWHYYEDEADITFVSFGGSLLAKYFTTDRKADKSPGSFSFGNTIAAIDEVYKYNGDLFTALRWGCNLEPSAAMKLLKEIEGELVEKERTIFSYYEWRVDFIKNFSKVISKKGF